MSSTTFILRPTDECIELNSLLKLKQIAQSGGHAHLLIEAGNVRVNGEQELRKRRKLRAGDVVVAEGVTITIHAAKPSDVA